MYLRLIGTFSKTSKINEPEDSSYSSCRNECKNLKKFCCSNFRNPKLNSVEMSILWVVLQL
jgi:hypothetical protein